MRTRGQGVLSVARTLALAMIGCAAMVAGDADAQDAVQRFVTQGRAQTAVDDLYKCPVKVSNHRVSAVGQITATDGTVITVPAETAFQKGATLKGADLYNECTQVTSEKSADVSTANVSVVEIDPDGEVITARMRTGHHYRANWPISLGRGLTSCCGCIG